MPPATVRSLVDDIRQRQLLDRDQVAQLVQDLSTRFTDPRALAQHLMQREWLTPYQINQLFQGLGAGLVLGQYRLLERLGEGGMGQVFKARHQGLGRVVALKVIRKDRISNPEAVRRFKREIKAASRLSHPNVVLGFDADEIDGTHFFAMEYVAGPDLGQIVKARGPVAVDLACEYIRQAALGLQHAHEQGLVHRDIKPSNLLVAEAGEAVDMGKTPGRARQGGKPVVKVLDLGLARWAWGNDDESMLSQENSVMGTPDFMAPEQAKNSQVDHRADVYSLGCTLFYILTGKPPFAGGSSIEKLLKHQTDAPPPLSQFRSDVPPGVQAVLDRMMAKRLDERYQSAAEAAEALAPFCPGADQAVRAAAAFRPARSQPVPVAAVAAAASTPAFTEIAPTPRTTGKIPVGPLPRLAALTRGRTRMIAAVAALAVFGMGGLLLVAAFAFSRSTAASTTGQHAAATNPASAPGTRPVVTTAPATAAPADRKADLWARAVPENASLLIAVNVSEMLHSPAFHQWESRLPEPFTVFKGQLRRMGVDINRDLDRLAVACVTPESNSPQVQYIILMQGNFSTKTFKDVATEGRWKPLPTRGSRANLILYQVDVMGGPAQYIGLVNESLLVLASSPQEIGWAYDRATAERNVTTSLAPVAVFLERLDKTTPPIPVAFFVGGNFRGAEMDGSLRRQFSIRDCQGFLRLGPSPELHVSIDSTGPEAVGPLKDKLQAFIDAFGQDESFVGKFFLALGRDALRTERTRVILNHSFSAAELEQIFARRR